MTYSSCRVAWYMPLSTTVGLSRIRNRGRLGRTLGYAAPIRESRERTLYYASVTIHPCDKVRFPTVGKIVRRKNSYSPHPGE